MDCATQKAMNTPVQVDVCASDITLSIQNGFQTAAKSFFPMQSALRSIPERQSLVAKPLVYVDALQANSRPSWSTDFSKRSEKGTGGRMRIPIHDASSYSTRICLGTD